MTTTEKCRGNSALGESTLDQCAGASSRNDEHRCPAMPVYRVTDGLRSRYVCGRHLAWQVRRMMTPGRSVTVTDLRERALGARAVSVPGGRGVDGGGDVRATELNGTHLGQRVSLDLDGLQIAGELEHIQHQPGFALRKEVQVPNKCYLRIASGKWSWSGYVPADQPVSLAAVGVPADQEAQK